MSFPNNKTTSYCVKLPQSIDLEGSGKSVCTPFPIQTPRTHYKMVWIHTSFMRIEVKPLSIILGFGGKDVILKKRQKALMWQT